MRPTPEQYSYLSVTGKARAKLTAHIDVLITGCPSYQPSFGLRAPTAAELENSEAIIGIDEQERWDRARRDLPQSN